MTWIFGMALGFFIMGCTAISWMIDALIYVGHSGNSELLFKACLGTAIVFLGLVVNFVAMCMLKRHIDQQRPVK